VRNFIDGVWGGPGDPYHVQRIVALGLAIQRSTAVSARSNSFDTDARFRPVDGKDQQSPP
jgi:hypothetical protein